MPSSIRSAALQLRAAGRVFRARRVSFRGALGPLDDRMVFVLGSPRSGTTFLARSIGSCPGFVDLGEVAPLKAAIPELAAIDPAAAAPGIRRLLTTTRRLGLVGRLRAVEQTPETAFVVRAVSLAFPQATLAHIVRDGRDVVCSLLDRGWLSAERGGADDAGLPLGPHPRFWVEPERSAEFRTATDARRAAWAWRRYVEAACSGGLVHEVRYERLVADAGGTAEELAALLGTSAETLAAAFGSAQATSIGRFRHDLTPEQLAEVEDEAGALLRALGYLQ